MILRVEAEQHVPEGHVSQLRKLIPEFSIGLKDIPALAVVAVKEQALFEHVIAGAGLVLYNGNV